MTATTTGVVIKVLVRWALVWLTGTLACLFIVIVWFFTF